MNCLDKKKLIQALTDRMESLQHRIDLDVGGGLTDDVGKYNEAKFWKEAIERNLYDIKVWE